MSEQEQAGINDDGALRELDAVWRSGTADNQKAVLYLLLLHKRALESAAAFREYWPRTTSTAAELVASTQLSKEVRSVAHQTLSLNALLKSDVIDAEKHAEKAPFEYLLAICRHVKDLGIRPSKSNLGPLLDVVEKAIRSSTTDELVFLDHCRHISRHFALMYQDEQALQRSNDYERRLTDPAVADAQSPIAEEEKQWVRKRLEAMMEDYMQTDTAEGTSSALGKFTEAGFEHVVTEIWNRHYLVSAPIPDNIMTISDEGMPSMPERSESATLVLYDGEAIEAGIEQGDLYAYVADAASGIAEAMNEVFGLDTAWTRDEGIFDGLLGKAVHQWNEVRFQENSRTRIFLAKQDCLVQDFKDYAINIAISAWQQKMAQAHGIRRTW